MSWLEAGADLVQNSDEWHEWRRRHIGASEIPAIMGTGHWGGAFDVYKAKTTEERWEGNFATQRGHALEIVALAKFEELHRVRLTKPSLEYEGFSFLSASLDGYSKSGGFIAEFKAPSFWKHTQALCGLVPECYEDQVQTQLLVTGFDLAYYVSFSDFQPEGFQYAEVIVRPDKARQALILQTAKRFWDMISKGEWRDDWNSEKIRQEDR